MISKKNVFIHNCTKFKKDLFLLYGRCAIFENFILPSVFIIVFDNVSSEYIYICILITRMKVGHWKFSNHGNFNHSSLILLTQWEVICLVRSLIPDISAALKIITHEVLTLKKLFSKFYPGFFSSFYDWMDGWWRRPQIRKTLQD